MDDKEILQEFINTRDKYVELEKYALKYLKKVIKETNVFVMDIGHRTKEVASLKGKISKKKGKYSDLKDITDLCGFRIICFFCDGVDKITECLPSYFEIDYENSIDKRKMLDATQFGYMSVHYICSLKKGSEVPEELTGIRFEIQIRSVLQHVWAEIEHDLGYKSEFGIPRSIRREFSTAASLLEVADNQFLQIRDCSQKYTEHVKQTIANNTADEIFIDMVSLKEYMNLNCIVKNLVSRISQEGGIELIYSDYTENLKGLEFVNITTLGELSAAIEKHEEYIYNKICEIFKTRDLDIAADSVILKILCEAILIEGNYSRKQVERYFACYSSDNEWIEKRTDRLFNAKR